jgi:hypothetical protein
MRSPNLSQTTNDQTSRKGGLNAVLAGARAERFVSFTRSLKEKTNSPPLKSPV